MFEWICRACGHVVLAEGKPTPLKWSDGHECDFVAMDCKVYVGHKLKIGPCSVEVFERDPKGFFPPRKPLKHVVRHSPDGFQWGYGGSGPADLALSILSDFVGQDRAEKLYQEFKRDFVANVKGDLFIQSGDIVDWMKEREKNVA